MSLNVDDAIVKIRALTPRRTEVAGVALRFDFAFSSQPISELIAVTGALPPFKINLKRALPNFSRSL